MSNWPIISSGYVNLDSGGATLVASSSSNTKGSWVEMIAATSATGWMTFHVNQQYGNRRFLFDIAIGASGSEVTILSNLSSSAGTDGSNRTRGFISPFMFMIPAGSRIAARCQCSTASSTLWLQVSIHPINFTIANGYSVCETIGANTSDSGGVTVTPGVGSMGSWYQISSGIGRDTRAFAATICMNNYAPPTQGYNINIGLTSSPSDMIIIEPFRMWSHIYGDTITPRYTPLFPYSIQAGEEIHVQGSAGSSATTFDIIIYLLS